MIHARGNRLVGIKKINQLTKGLFKEGKPGDRFILEITNETDKRMKTIVIPVKN